MNCNLVVTALQILLLSALWRRLIMVKEEGAARAKLTKALSIYRGDVEVARNSYILTNLLIGCLVG